MLRPRAHQRGSFESALASLRRRLRKLKAIARDHFANVPLAPAVRHALDRGRVRWKEEIEAILVGTITAIMPVL